MSARAKETQLAALAFTFPVIMIVQSVSHGLGIGAGSVVARSASKRSAVQRLATDAFILSVIVASCVMVIGMLTIEPLFAGMGATDAEMPYVRDYMMVWYIGVPMVVVPIVGNNIIRAMGDTKVTGIVMMVAAGVNILLDPLLIFGIWIFPPLGVVGAAIATVVSRVITLLVALYVLIVREKLISFKGTTPGKMLRSFGRILHVGIPSALTKAIIPAGSYIITGMLAVYGTKVVAGYGAGVRVEFVATSVLLALSAVMISFIGQNYGAGRLDRLKEGFRFSCVAGAIYSAGMYAVLFFAVPYIAPVFNSDAVIQQNIVLYIRIALAGLAFQGGVQIVGAAFNAVGKPLLAALVSIVQMFVLYVPLAFVFSAWMGQAGIFVALAVSYAISAAFGYLLFTRFLARQVRLRAESAGEAAVLADTVK